MEKTSVAEQSANRAEQKLEKASASRLSRIFGEISTQSDGFDKEKEEEEEEDRIRRCAEHQRILKYEYCDIYQETLANKKKTVVSRQITSPFIADVDEGHEAEREAIKFSEKLAHLRQYQTTKSVYFPSEKDDQIDEYANSTACTIVEGFETSDKESEAAIVEDLVKIKNGATNKQSIASESFLKFSKLAKELRDQIWSQILPLTHSSFQTQANKIIHNRRCDRSNPQSKTVPHKHTNILRNLGPRIRPPSRPQ
jgi:hypothetical protein